MWKEKLAKLIDVKSIVTLIFTLLIGGLAMFGKITGEQVMMTYTTIIAFYFGTQSQKKETENIIVPTVIDEPKASKIGFKTEE